MQYTSEIETQIQKTSKWYWQKHLRHYGTIEVDDIVQICRLHVLNRQVNKSLTGLELQYKISSTIFGNTVERPILTVLDTTEYTPTILYTNITKDQYERMLENMWVVGNHNIYYTLKRYSEGETTNKALEPVTLRRGAMNVRKAFPTQELLFSTKPAQWFPPQGRTPLKFYQLTQAPQKDVRSLRELYPELVYFKRSIKAYALTDKGFKHVENFPAEQKTFLARQG